MSAAAAAKGADERDRGSGSSSTLDPQPQQHRVAVLLPFLGRDFPPWFRAFADACGGGSPSQEDLGVGVDWVVLHEGARCVISCGVCCGG